MNRLIVEHILELADYDEEIKNYIPLFYCGNSNIFVSFSVVSQLFDERTRIISQVENEK